MPRCKLSEVDPLQVLVPSNMHGPLYHVPCRAPLITAAKNHVYEYGAVYAFYILQ